MGRFEVLNVHDVDYKIYSIGAVTTMEDKYIEVVWPKEDGKDYVILDGNTMLLAKLVAEAFLGPTPKGMQIGYKEEAYSNLENLHFVPLAGNKRAVKPVKIIHRRSGTIKTISDWSSYEDKINWVLLARGKRIGKDYNRCNHIGCDVETPYKLCREHKDELENKLLSLREEHGQIINQDQLIKLREIVEELQDIFGVFNFLDASSYSIDDYK